MIRLLLPALTLGLGGCAQIEWYSGNVLSIAIVMLAGVGGVLTSRSYLWILFMAIALTACVSPTQAAELLNQALLRDVICHHETRGERARGENIDLLPPGPNGELGRCQITLAGAKRVGFDETQWLLLLIGPFSEYWAGRVIADCVVRGRSTAYSAAFCYNAGPRARISKWHPSHQYAMAVQEGYNRALVEKGRN